MATVAENINQAKSDLLGCKAAIIAKGVEIPYGTPTSDYAEKIGEIQGGGATLLESWDISDGTLIKAETGIEGKMVATIPGNVTTISNSAYQDNQLITDVVMPNSVTSVGDGEFTWQTIGAFANCKNLKSVKFSEQLTTIAACMFAKCVNLDDEHFSIPNSITTIKESAFRRCTNLVNVSIPNSVTSMGESIFEGCTRIESFSIGSGMTIIPNYTFLNCTGLESINIPAHISTIGESAFQSCTGLERVTLEEGLLVIGAHAFLSCSNLQEITIPEGCTLIGVGCFAECSNLSSAYIPSSVSEIQDYAFQNCTSLFDIYYTGTQAEWENITIGNNAIPAGVTIHYDYTPSNA